MTQERATAIVSAGTVTSTQHNSGVRFSLKKRSIRSSKDVVNLSSYNSDFLNGLFEDVARATDCNVPPPCCAESSKRSSDLISDSDIGSVEELEMTPQRKAKKSRTNSIVSPYSFRTSTFDLCSLEKQATSDATDADTDNTPAKSKNSQEEECSQDIRRTQDSLAFQLNCVSRSDEDCTNNNISSAIPAVEDAAKMAFPNLPATVSDSSCNSGLTRANLVRQASNPENNSTKESFGWFVDLDVNDNNQTPETNMFLPYAVSTDSLAFQAPTAPKRVNDDAELEWAQAADTVDDVLGDFF